MAKDEVERLKRLIKSAFEKGLVLGCGDANPWTEETEKQWQELQQNMDDSVRVILADAAKEAGAKF
jgi:hypothetical protein